MSKTVSFLPWQGAKPLKFAQANQEVLSRILLHCPLFKGDEAEGRVGVIAMRCLGQLIYYLQISHGDCTKTPYVSVHFYTRQCQSRVLLKSSTYIQVLQYLPVSTAVWVYPNWIFALLKFYFQPNWKIIFKPLEILEKSNADGKETKRAKEKQRSTACSPLVHLPKRSSYWFIIWKPWCWLNFQL